jgi:transglutaminase-like putative cysteine protease
VETARAPREKAVRLFYAVRDRIRYDPYTVSRQREEYRASRIAGADRAFCIPKALLLAALARGEGIPSRLGFADVRNHLASDQLRARMGTDLFVFHGYAELHLEGSWVKATPAFNQSLCERLGVLPLEWDGTHDAIFHPFDAEGRRHMEYVRDRGTWPDLPFEEMVQVLGETYTISSLEAGREAAARDPIFHGD